MPLTYYLQLFFGKDDYRNALEDHKNHFYVGILLDWEKEYVKNYDRA